MTSTVPTGRRRGSGASSFPAVALAAVLAVLVAVLLAAVAPPPAVAQEAAAGPPAEPPVDLDGDWEGKLEGPPAPMEVSLTLERDGGTWRGAVTIPVFVGVRDLPLGRVEVRADSAIFELWPGTSLRMAPGEDVMQGRFVVEEGDDWAAGPARLYRVNSSAWKDFAARWEERREEREKALAALRPPPLERTAEGPGADRVDSGALQRLVEAARASHSAGLAVLHDGELVGAWHAGGESRPVEAMSVTKAVVNLAVGRLLTTGLLETIDVPVHAFYPEWSKEPYSSVTVRHLLTHTSGLESPTPTISIYQSEDFVRFALESELVEEPGSEIRYNNNALNLLAGIVGLAAERRMDRFLAEELFAPLGIEDFDWSLDEAGNPHGMSGIQIRPEDLARLGQFALQRGEWEGERLIDEEWFDESFTPVSEEAEFRGMLMGMLWFLIREDGRTVGILHDGDLGQYLVIYPEERLVGVRMVEAFPGFDLERDVFLGFREMLRELVD